MRSISWRSPAAVIERRGKFLPTGRNGTNERRKERELPVLECGGARVTATAPPARRTITPKAEGPLAENEQCKQENQRAGAEVSGRLGVPDHRRSRQARGGARRDRQCLREHGVSAAVHEGLRSEGGRYRTLKAPVVLTGREMMNALSAALAAVDGVKFLL